VTRLGWILMGALVATIVAAAASAAAPDRKPPRIVAAAMLDTDRDALSDRVRLTYSERIRHVRDADGRYPFAVTGYRIRSVGAASGKVLVILLVEPGQPDTAAAPVIRYGRTRAQPVRDRAGNQAPTQAFARTRAHGHVPATQPSPGVPTPADADGDGTPDPNDCAPKDAAIHPGAPDRPDLRFVDSNCDGIDGTEREAIFVSPNGNDANAGTKARPKRELQAAIATVLAGNGRYLLVAFGTYARVKLAPGTEIYGGYDPSSWARQDRFPDGLPLVSGSPEGVLAAGARDVVLQHLRIRGSAGGGRSAYGIRAIGNAELTLQHVAVSAGDGAAGPAGAAGQQGTRGGAGGPGGGTGCEDVPLRGSGGKGGSSRVGRTGGVGGTGSQKRNDGEPGGEGKFGTPGGPGGTKGNPGKPGGKGQNGENGATGPAGRGSSGLQAGVTDTWIVQSGSGGGPGLPGDGGGGGGGGGAQVGLFVDDGIGNGGGGGGGGGAGGGGGKSGEFGGGSFGVYLFDSKLTVENSLILAGAGGAGGRGGDGGLGGAGGAGGEGGKVCTSEVGAGGDGGFGGAGGRGGGGGGGAGGPSFGIFKGGTSTAILKGASKVTAGTPGVGGAGGNSGPGGRGSPGQAGIARAVFP
jgi:hypothetical protein